MTPNPTQPGRTPRAIYFAFAVSGVAGLTYEVLWSRYLSLYVGHGAYAQVLVLSVYLGGMAVGSLAAAGITRRLARPLLAYVYAEIGLAGFGVVFHWVFVFATDLTYDVVFPAVGSAPAVGAIRWGLAGLLILPQAILLGTTFPLMAAALFRDDAERPGRGVAFAYFLNAAGGAAGVLIAGFWLIGWLGLPGTSIAAALLNLVAAAAVWRVMDGPVEDSVAASQGARGSGQGSRLVEGRVASADPGWMGERRTLGPLLLTVTFGTAFASFAYEIGWIRMLSLVLGSATHSFELMLSAFILGLAIGAWLIRDIGDRSADPVRLLGAVQVLMGLAAVLSIPLYAWSFDLMAGLMRTLPDRTGGYALYNLSRYGICLLVMLPATTFAGMTLPLIVGSLLRAGAGEASIGRVYAVNTIGSVVGAGVAGLVALPYLGLKGLLLAGAGLDVALGLGLLGRSQRVTGRGARWGLIAVGASAVLFGGVGFGARLSPTLLGSGVFRRGEIPTREQHLSLYYQDGRTATVSAHVGRSDGVIVLATNGKPDASIGPRWRMERRDTMPVRPIPAGRDFATQILAPMVGVAHNPGARNVANIGHGSGITATALLTSPAVERLVTIEIEPLMVEGSLVFLPANGPAFADPRSTFVFDDAKSFFSYAQERFDLIFTEPSNPWVSGAASLFTKEFYERVAGFLADGGVFVQWIQIYEIDDELFLSVLAALDAVFPSYRAYLVGDADVAIVARADGPLADPDWGPLRSDGFQRLTASAPAFTAEIMDALLMFDESTFRVLLDGEATANSDYRPLLDTRAERARFHQSFAQGVYAFADRRVDLGRVLAGRTRAPGAFDMVPAYGLVSAVLSGRAAWLREALAAGGGIAPEEFPEWNEELLHLQDFLTGFSAEMSDFEWQLWASSFSRAEAALHWGTSGWTDPTFYGAVERFLATVEEPRQARATVDLARAFALGEWDAAAQAADEIVSRVAAGELWVPSVALLDMSVVAYLRAGRLGAARYALRALAPRALQAPGDLRLRLLEALVAEAQGSSEAAPNGPST